MNKSEMIKRLKEQTILFPHGDTVVPTLSQPAKNAVWSMALLFPRTADSHMISLASLFRALDIKPEDLTTELLVIPDSHDDDCSLDNYDSDGAVPNQQDSQHDD